MFMTPGLALFYGMLRATSVLRPVTPRLAVRHP
jgi:ammonia channel protein AmtB